MKQIIFDFDGTLVDSKPRMYALFKFLVPQVNLSFEEYWNLKKDKVSHSTILSSSLGFSKADIDTFHTSWLNLIEKPEWLEYDKPIQNVGDCLSRLSRHYTLFLLTNRQIPSMVDVQLHSFGWTNYFSKVLVTCQTTTKEELINQHLEIKQGDWMVGDTGKDIEVGRVFGMKTAAVLSGFLNHERLKEYHPDIICPSVVEIDFETD